MTGQGSECGAAHDSGAGYIVVLCSLLRLWYGTIWCLVYDSVAHMIWYVASSMPHIACNIRIAHVTLIQHGIGHDFVIMVVVLVLVLLMLCPIHSIAERSIG